MKRAGDLAKKLAEAAEKAKEKKTVTALRRPPRGKEDISKRYDIGTKDNRSIMDVAVFRLSKKDKRAGEIIRYEMPDGYVEVKAGPDGMASVWDYDIVLMAISRLTEAMNQYRKGERDKPGRVFRPKASEILKFCRRSDGGKQKDDLVEAMERLSTTHIKMERVKKMTDGQAVVISEGESLISRYRVISRERSGKVDTVEIEIPSWIYEEVVESPNPDVLTVHPDFFLIEPGIGRFLYRLARKAAGKGQAKWTFKTLYERSGSTGKFKEFCRLVRKLIESNDLPEYTLAEESGHSGPLLVMTRRQGV
jgi:plasmid replication initiation protein